MFPDGLRWSQMISDGLRWSQMVSDSPRWSQIVSITLDGPKWSQIVSVTLDGPGGFIINLVFKTPFSCAILTDIIYNEFAIKNYSPISIYLI